MIQALGLLLSLFIVVVLVMRRVYYGLALLIGAFVLGVFSKVSFQGFVEVFISTFTDRSTLDLVLIVSLIPVLASFMKEVGMVDDLINEIKEVVSGRAVLAVLPALMGALPMLGGALLSAPLIDEEANRLGLLNDEKSFINVWFRHWNFFIYPLSSALILVASLTGFNLYMLILMHIPPVLIYLILGYLLSIRSIKEDKIKRSRDLRVFLSIPFNMSPILLAIILNFVGVHMAAALAMAAIFTLAIKRVSPRKALILLRENFNWKLPLAMISVMYLRHMVEYSNSVPALIPYIESIGLPVNLLLLAITWIIGLATAMPTAGIAIIFPIAILMIKNLSIFLVSILYFTMIFSYLVSPLHLCLILTVEYYRSKLQRVYQKLIPASIIAYLLSILTLSLMLPFLGT